MLSIYSFIALGFAALAFADSDSTLSLSLSSTPDCTTVGAGPSQLVKGECYTIPAGIQSFEFYEESASFKMVDFFSGEQCGGETTTGYTTEFVGCGNLGFTALSVRYE